MRLVLILLVFRSFSIDAQHEANFNRLKSEGSIPDDFTQLSTTQFEQDYAKNEDSKLDVDFYLSTRFYTDELLQSGTVLFNTPHSNYVREIGKYILKDNQTLYDELRFYVVRSNVVNAYSTDQGILIFTTGLLAHLENEAQLAFIVAHEIAHYIQKHSRKQYIVYKDFYSINGDYRRYSYLDALNKLSLFSKEQELEADSIGAVLYLNTNYDPVEIENSLFMLQYGHLPFDDVAFDLNFLATNELIIPNSLLPDTVTSFDTNFDYNDDYSTHPNIQKRIEAARVVWNQAGSKDFELFKVLPESQFKELQNLVRFESISIDLAERYYGDALYSTYIMLKSFPENRFLLGCKMKALYGLAKYRNKNRYDEVTTRLKNVQGESYKLHYFLRQLKQDQLNIIVYRHLFDLSQKFPEDLEIKAYFDDFEKEFILYSDVKFEELQSISLNEEIQNNPKDDGFNLDDSIQKINNSDLSKFDKAQLKKELYDKYRTLTTVKPSEDFHHYGLFDLVQNKNFVVNLKAKKEQLTAENIALESINEAKEKKIKSQGYKLGIKKILVVDPVYKDYRLNGDNNYTKSEKRQIETTEEFYQNFHGLDIEVKILDSKELDKEAIDEYNDLSLIKDWRNETAGHQGIDIISSNHFRLKEICKKYGVTNFVFNNISSYKDRNEFQKSDFLLYSTVILIPFLVADLIIIHNNFVMTSFVLDAETDNIIMTQTQDVNLNATPKIIKSYIYNLMVQINSEDK